MIDRKARDEMSAAIHAYMDEKITAFDFDGTLAETMRTTDDKTVWRVGQALWHHYDDLKDHKIVASKQEWDYFNRLLLLLQSDGEIEVVKTTIRWHLRQAIAATCLGAFGFVVLQTGFGAHVLVFVTFFGIVSMVIGWLNSHEKRKRYREGIAITPFPSVSNLFSIRRRVRGFKKQPYPKTIKCRTIRSPFMDRIATINSAIIWLMFSPVALFFQMLPERESETRIIMPAEEDSGPTLSACP